MKNKRRALLIFLILLVTFQLGYSQSQTNKRAKWFTESRLGMFIHWGIYSGAEGFWKGEKIRHNNDYAEWIMYRNNIEKNEYLELIKHFDWNKIDPEKWVVLAKNSGMKYITFTAKHHDGFALWKSDVSDYNVWNYSYPQRDILGELAQACKKHDMKLGLYYSHWIDWEHEFGWKHNMEIDGISAEKYDIYWQEKLIPQIKELLTNYGEIDLFWFDMWIHHSETVVTKRQLMQVKNLIRELQPNCLINSRLGLSLEEDSDIDFKTLGDNQLGNKKEDFPWQSPATVAHSWGFHADDSKWKSTTTLLKSLINNVSLNGNFMLNIGPRANGDVPYEIEQRLLEMGKWLHTNGESIYGAQAFDLDKNSHDWGRITSKQSGEKTTLFLHIYNWPIDEQIILSGVANKPEKIYLLFDNKKKDIGFEFKDVITKIDLSNYKPDNYISVIAVEYNSFPKVITDIVSINSQGGYALSPDKCSFSNKKIDVEKKSRYGTVPEHLVVSEPQILIWKIFVEEPCTKSVDISYSFQGKKPKGSLKIKIGENIISHNFENSGKTVGEPNSNWVIDSFKSFRLGKVDFPDKGFYEVELEINPHKKEKLDFQWIWIK